MQKKYNIPSWRNLSIVLEIAIGIKVTTSRYGMTYGIPDFRPRHAFVPQSVRRKTRPSIIIGNVKPVT